METLKGDTLGSIHKAMRIIGQFPKQVIVLKGTKLAWAVRGHVAGLQKRLIDHKQTLEFPRYIRMLQQAENGNEELRKQLLRLGSMADSHLDEQVLNTAAMVAPTFDEFASRYTKEERAIIREGQDFTSPMLRRLGDTVVDLGINMIASSPVPIKKPSYEELPNTLYFRVALCSYLLALRWGANGGAKDARVALIRNDLVDVMMASYATYFDGLMTKDAKVTRIYDDACTFLVGLFDAAVPTLKFVKKSRE